MQILSLLLAIVPATLGNAPLPEMLVKDDECASGDGGKGMECSLHALQMQAAGTSSSSLESRGDELAEESSSHPKKVQTDLTIPHRKLLHANLTKFQGEILRAWAKIENVSKQVNATKAKVDKCVHGEKLTKKHGEGNAEETSDGTSESDDDDSDDVDWSFPGSLVQTESAAKHRRRFHEPKRVARTRKELSYEYQELKIFWDTFNYIRKTAVYIKQLMDSNRLPKVQHDLTDFEIPDGLGDPDSGGGSFPDFEDPDEEDEDDESDEDSEKSTEGSGSGTSSESSATTGGAASPKPKVHHAHRRRRRTIPDYMQLRTDVSKIDEQLVDIGHQMEEIQGVVEEAGDKVSNYCEAKQNLAKKEAPR